MALQKLGRYEILGELGKGAMGVVYLARDPVIGRQLAIKTFRVPFSPGDRELELFRDRFIQEAKSAGSLSHPNIVTIHDVLTGKDGAVFLVMEYIQGTDLKQLMQRQDGLDPRFVVDVVAQIADGLDHAHAKGVIHRDIKPANIILTGKQLAKITDFGIAHIDTSDLTTEGQLLGTPNYMSPEMIRGQPVDHRADIFSLGVMLYEMLTRQKPFAGQNLTTVTHKIVSEPFAPPEKLVPELPPGLVRVLDRALAKDPDQRYGKAGEMAADLRAVYAPQAAPASATSGSFLAGGGMQPAAAPGEPPPDAGLPPAPGTVTTPAAAGQPNLAPDRPRSGVPAAPAPPSKKVPVLWIAGVLVLVLAVAGLLTLAMTDRGDAGAGPEGRPPGYDPEAEIRDRYLPHVEEGRRLLAEGDPRGALAAFDQALAIVPDDREIRQLRSQAEAAAGLGGEEPAAGPAARGPAGRGPVERGLAEAGRALAERDYRRAIERAEEVLELEPGNRDARDLLAEAREGQRRRDQVRERLSTGGRPTVPATGGEDSAPPAAPPVAGKATLAIDFHSEVAEGRVTIYAGQEKIYQESFQFGKKRRRRSSPVSGRLTASHELASGAVTLRVYVTLKDIPGTKTAEVDADLAAGTSATLEVSLSPEGRLAAEVR